MSKNIVIQEGGVNKTLNAIKKIQTAKSGNGEVLWVPEEEVQLTSKHISKNGTYKASNDNAYGYKSVTVNVAGGNGSADSSGKPTGTVPPGGSGSAVTGKDPDTGNESVVGVDENGDLVTTKIPSSIKVTKLPDKTSYQDGDTLNPSGIIVHGYFGDGTDYGTIQNSELKFDPLVARSGMQTDLFSMCLSLEDGDEVFFRHGIPKYGELSNFTVSQVNNNSSYITQYVCVVYEENIGYYGACFSAHEGYAIYPGSNGITATNHMSKQGSIYCWFDNTRISDSRSTFSNDYPTIDKSVIDTYLNGGMSKVTVSWARPTDQKVLTDTFNVNISGNSGGDIDHEYTGPQE